MEIILLEKIQNLGDLGDTVKVANGYARNFLIPQKKAVLATDRARALVEERRRQLAEEESKRLEVARARADLGIREVTVTRLVGESGQLYGSVSPADVAGSLTEAGCRVEKAEVLLPAGPIKQVGEFTAEVTLHPEVRFTVKITVLGEGGNPPPEQPEVSVDLDSTDAAAADTTDASTAAADVSPAGGE